MTLNEYLEKLEQIEEDGSALRVYTEAKVNIPKLVKMVRMLNALLKESYADEWIDEKCERIIKE